MNQENLNNQENNNQPKPKKKIWKGVAIAFIAIIVLSAVFGGNGENKQSEQQIAPSDEQNQEVSETMSQAVGTPKKEIPKEEPFEAQLTSGNYTCGIDFPEGKYDIIAISGSGNVSSSNMYSGGLNEIMGTPADEFSIDTFNNAKFKKGDVLSVSSVTIKISSDSAKVSEIQARENPLTETVSLGSGNFVAGEDFKSGVYDVVAVSGSGNVSSDNMFDGGLNAIMGTSNNGFDEKEYKNIVFTDGVALSVSGVNIKLVPSK